MSNTSEVRSDALVFLSKSKGVKCYLDWGRIVTIVETRVLLPYWKAIERDTGTLKLPRLGVVVAHHQEKAILIPVVGR